MRKLYNIANANTTLEEAWDLCQSVPEIKQKFDKHAELFTWPDNPIFGINPYWAYWFSRHIICDHWPPAEELINQDDEVAKAYRSQVETYKVCKILNYSVDGDPTYILDDNGQIIRRRHELPAKPVKKTRRQFDDTDMDRIVERVEVFRKQRQQRIEEDEL